MTESYTFQGVDIDIERTPSGYIVTAAATGCEFHPKEQTTFHAATTTRVVVATVPVESRAIRK